MPPAQAPAPDFGPAAPPAVSTPAAAPTPVDLPAASGPALSALVGPFLSEQVPGGAWERQSAAQARAIERWLGVYAVIGDHGRLVTVEHQTGRVWRAWA